MGFFWKKKFKSEHIVLTLRFFSCRHSGRLNLSWYHHTTRLLGSKTQNFRKNSKEMKNSNLGTLAPYLNPPHGWGGQMFFSLPKKILTGLKIKVAEWVFPCWKWLGSLGVVLRTPPLTGKKSDKGGGGVQWWPICTTCAVELCGYSCHFWRVHGFQSSKRFQI